MKETDVKTTLHCLYPSFFWDLPEIPVVPQGFTDLIATALVD